MSRLLFLSPLLVLALAGCSKNALQGNWSVDIDATIEKARSRGLPDSSVPQIREIYGDGLLEITNDSLVMRIVDFSEATARNYEIVGEADGCYSLKISNTPGVHRYCIEGDHLVVHDPGAKLTIVYKRE